MHHYPRRDCYHSKFVEGRMFATPEEAQKFDTDYALETLELKGKTWESGPIAKAIDYLAALLPPEPSPVA